MSKITVACLFSCKEGSLLLKRNVKPYGWGLVGGYVKENEHIEQAIIREVFEETGLDIDPSQLIPAGYIFTGNGDLCFLFFYWLGNSAPVIKLSGEHSKFIFLRAINNLEEDKWAGRTKYFVAQIIYVVSNMYLHYKLLPLSNKENLCFSKIDDDISSEMQSLEKDKTLQIERSNDSRTGNVHYDCCIGCPESFNNHRDTMNDRCDSCHPEEKGRKSFDNKKTDKQFSCT